MDSPFKRRRKFIVLNKSKHILNFLQKTFEFLKRNLKLFQNINQIKLKLDENLLFELFQLIPFQVHLFHTSSIFYSEHRTFISQSFKHNSHSIESMLS